MQAPGETGAATEAAPNSHRPTIAGRLSAADHEAASLSCDPRAVAHAASVPAHQDETTACLSCDPRARRAQRRQGERRGQEENRRRAACAAAARCRPLATCRQVSGALGIPERTLRHWRSNPIAKTRGRPLKTATLGKRQQVVKFLSETTGPAIGLPSLRAIFPALPRCILADLLSRYRKVWRHRYRRDGYRLVWHHPGRVWAMDHSETSQLVDGQYEEVFVARDLGSHRQLTWSAVSGTGADEACQLLEQLFVTHGPPLVLKSDQGSAFVSQRMQQLLKKWQVTPLFSPKGLPQYNGALERSNSTNKTYTHQQAVAQGHPCYWTSENLAAAQQLANTITRPWGHDGPSPDQAWQQRTPITTQERNDFQSELEKQRKLVRKELGLTDIPKLTPVQQDRLERRAISAALESLGYLSKHSTRRPPRKAKRPQHTQLQQALKQQREQASPASLDEAAARAALSEDESRVDLVEMLALSVHDDTMQATAGAQSLPSTASAPEPTHGESAHPTWLRRLITPAIKVAKAAKIMR